MENPKQALLYYLRLPLVHLKAELINAFAGTNALVRYMQRVDKVYIAQLLRAWGAEIGKPVSFNTSIIIDNPAISSRPFKNLIIGDNCFIGTNAFFDLPDRIILNNQVVISAGVKILTHQDCGGRLMSKYYPRKQEEVVIGEGSWIGVDAIILAGTKIGKSCVIAAGSVVTSDVSDYSVVGGSPAKLIKSLPK